VLIDAQKHQVYHKLFGNKTPKEIMNYLNSYFWKDKYIIRLEERRANESPED